MPMRRFRSEQIIAKLRQIEVQLAQGKNIALACKDAAISEQSYFRWRKEYGGLQIEQRSARRISSGRMLAYAGPSPTSLEKRSLEGISPGNV